MFSWLPKSSNLIVLIPLSSLGIEQTPMLKTLKIGQIIRIMNIYKVEKLFFYPDEENQEKISELLSDIVNYTIKPPYMKKKIAHNKSLRFVGILPPINSPNHIGVVDDKFIYREGIIKNVKKNQNQSIVDIYFSESQTIKIKTKSMKSNQLKVGLPVKIKISKETNEGSIINQMPCFWGTQVKIIDGNLKKFINNVKNEEYTVIAATKNAEPLSLEKINHFRRDKQGLKKLILMFGPVKGSFKKYLMKNEIDNKLVDYWINFIPDQGTITVRIEEAISSTLGILNLLID